MDIDFDLDVTSYEFVGVASVSSHSEDALQFHDLVDCTVATLNLKFKTLDQYQSRHRLNILKSLREKVLTVDLP